MELQGKKKKIFIVILFISAVAILFSSFLPLLMYGR